MTEIQYNDLLRALCQMAAIAEENGMEDAMEWKEKLHQILYFYYTKEC